MYYDFSKANFEIFEKNAGETYKEIVQKVVLDDRFIERFNADENYDLIADFYRLQRLANSNEVMNGGTQMDMICFDANCIKECSDISDFRRGSYIVVCQKGKVVSFPKKTI
ncbi:MAG: hypothetical protein IJA44_00365 [Clostridia bacterium]|nr:hypothetical protein [Clostridia bacterium]